QPVVVASRSATVVRAWKVVVVFLPLFRSTIEYAPAALLRIRKRDFPFSKRLTCAPAAAAPAWVTLPDARTIRSPLFVTFALSVIAPLETSARVSTVPAAFGAPPAQGVVMAFQTVSPGAMVKTLSTVKVASSSRAPFGERPGVPTGTSSGARQTTSLYEPSAASAPESWSTWTGRLMLLLATASARFQTAMCGTGSQPGALVVGGTATTSPESGNGMFASRANTVPVVVPIFVPAVAEALIE